MEDEERGEFSALRTPTLTPGMGSPVLPATSVGSRSRSFMCTQFATMRTAESFGDQICNVECMGRMSKDTKP
jgi:hypothetical protein